MTIVCGDSHTATHGAFGSIAFGIGTSEVEHVLATQTLPQSRPKWMSVTVDGDLQPGVTAKDVILAILGEIGTAAASATSSSTADRHSALSMEGRMTVCNMSIEAGAKAGLIAPDETTFDYLEGRAQAHRAPTGMQPLPTGGPCTPMMTPSGTRKSCSMPRRSLRTSRGAPTPARSPPSTHRFLHQAISTARPPRRPCSARSTTWASSRPKHARRQRRHCVHRFVHQQPDRRPPCRRHGDGRPSGHRAARDDRSG